MATNLTGELGADTFAREVEALLKVGGAAQRPACSFGEGDPGAAPRWRVEDATLIPPPVSHLGACLLDLEDFLRADASGPATMALPLRMAVAHGVGHAVEIAVDRDHAVAGDAPLQPQHGLERPSGQRPQAGALLREMLADYTVGGGVNADVGDLVEPLAELVVEVAQAGR